MAVTENRRMQQLRGKYADLDKSKMLVGEIAVPSDHSPIMKIDTNKYIELVSSEDTEYIEKIIAEIEQTLDDVNQLAIDKVGINNSVESDLQTYSSRKIQSMHDEQAESITNQITDQFKVLSGTEIVASDSSSGYATDFSCVGKSEQKQYSGVNMCSLVDKASTTSNGVTYSCNNQLVSASGTSTGNADIGVNFAKNITFEAGKSYTISLQGNFTHSANINAYFFNVSTNAYNTPFGIDSTNVGTFTFSETITTSSILLRGFSGNTMSGLFKVQIEEGSTATDYEPYVGGTPSPNPNYPQAIMKSGDCVELMQGVYMTTGGNYSTSNAYVCNKEPIPCKSGDILAISIETEFKGVHFLFYNESGYMSYSTLTDLSGNIAVPSGATYFNIDIVGVNGSNGTLLLADVGKVKLTINGKYVLQVKSVNKNLYPLENEPFTLVKSTARTKTLDFVPLKSGTYTISFKVSNAKLNGNTAGLNIVNTAGVSKTVATISGNGVVSGILTDDIRRLYFFVASNEADTATVTISDIQIEYGDTVTDYVPHAESISTILLDEPLRTTLDGSVKDLITCQDGVYGVLRGMRRKVYSSSDLVGVSEKYTNIVYYSLPKPTDISGYGKYSNVKALSDKFIRYTGTLDDDSAIGGMIMGAKTTAVWFGFAYGTTLEEAQSIGDIEFVYPLAEPVFEPFADQTPFYNIPTYEGGTVISTTDRLQPQIEVEYPTNRVSGVASEGYAKASALTDKFLTYQFRNVTDMDSLGAYLYVNLPSGVDAKDCTLLVSFCHSTVPYSEMSVANWIYTPLESEMQSSIYTTQGIDSIISIYFPKVTSGYLHANVTVIRNDI